MASIRGSQDSVHEQVIIDSVCSPENAAKKNNKIAQEGATSEGRAHAIVVGDMSSDLSLRAREPSPGQLRAKHAWDRRILVDGVRLIPCSIFTTLLVILCLVAIAIPTVFMGMGPHLAQKAVGHTYITLHNIRVSNWAHVQQNASNVCEPFAPSSMTVVQDILFENIPWYGSMGPAVMQPPVLTLSFQGKHFADLYLPEIDLSHPEDGKKWAKDVACQMVVKDPVAFVLANKELVPLGTVTKGWTIWNQDANVVLKQTLMGITSYYAAHMNQDVNVSYPAFTDGPLEPTKLKKNLLTTLKCVSAAASAH